jgi:hypothetical protein
MMLRNHLLLLGYSTAVFLLFGSSTVAAVLIGIGAGLYCRNPPNLWTARHRRLDLQRGLPHRQLSARPIPNAMSDASPSIALTARRSLRQPRRAAFFVISREDVSQLTTIQRVVGRDTDVIGWGRRLRRRRALRQHFQPILHHLQGRRPVGVLAGLSILGRSLPAIDIRC